MPQNFNFFLLRGDSRTTGSSVIITAAASTYEAPCKPAATPQHTILDLVP